MSETSGKGLPLVAWRLKTAGKFDGELTFGWPLINSIVTFKINISEFAIARTLRSRGWIVPAYTMAPHTESMKLLRVVVREDFSMERCHTFLRDLADTVSMIMSIILMDVVL